MLLLNGAEYIRLIDSVGNSAEFDSIDDAIVFTEYEHHAIHLGILYSLNVYDSVVFGSPKYCQFKTGSGYIHLKQKPLLMDHTHYFVLL